MTALALLFTLSAIGISETAYLIRKKIAHEKPVCYVGKKCHQVLESKYNKIFGVPNEAMGMLFYVSVSLITAFLVIGVKPVGLWVTLVKISILGGTVPSAILIYMQWRIIKAWCFWCVLSATTVFLMAAIVLLSDLTFVS